MLHVEKGAEDPETSNPAEKYTWPFSATSCAHRRDCTSRHHAHPTVTHALTHPAKSSPSTREPMTCHTVAFLATLKPASRLVRPSLCLPPSFSVESRAGALAEVATSAATTRKLNAGTRRNHA